MTEAAVSVARRPLPEAGGVGLPELLLPGEYSGSVSEWLQAAAWQYQRIVDGHIRLWGRPVLAEAAKAADGRGEAFWHMVTDDAGGSVKTRRLNLLRAAFIGSVWHTLELLAARDPRVVWWRQRKRRVIVAPVNFTLCVVLDAGRHSFILVTAFPLGSSGRRSAWERAAESWGSGRSRRDAFAHHDWREQVDTWRPPAAGLRPRLRELEVIV